MKGLSILKADDVTYGTIVLEGLKRADQLENLRGSSYPALGTGFRSEACGSENAHTGRGPATDSEFPSMVPLECQDSSEVWGWEGGEDASEESLSLADSGCLVLRNGRIPS